MPRGWRSRLVGVFGSCMSLNLLQLILFALPLGQRGKNWPIRGASGRQLQRRVLRLRHDKIQADAIIKAGTPGEAILAEAEDVNADMIVMGASGRHGLKRLVLGSVAEYVVGHAACPVLTLKTPH